MAEADPKFAPVENAEEAAPAQNAPPADGENPPSRVGKRVRLALMLAVPLLLLALGGYFWIEGRNYASTDNAYIHQDTVSVAAEIAGPIVEVAVKENERVEAGDLLFRIDPTPYRIALAQAEADLASAKVGVGQLQTRAQGTSVDISGAQEDIRFAQDNFQRQQDLLDRGFTTRADWEDARHDLQQARESLRQAEAARDLANSALSRGDSANYPAVAAAEARIEQAKLNLKRTEVHAPVAGVISQTDRLQVGQQTMTGVPAVSIVVSDGSWIEANFKETDLARMQPGQPVRVEIDAYPGLELNGHVASIGAGTGSNFSLLPPQNATGNWVKVTQRVPVRIEFDETSPRPLIAGLSADVRVDLRADGDR